MNDFKRWRGLRALITDAVEHGASAIERVHLETARRPFEVIEQITGAPEPAQNFREVHDTIVSGVYTTIRLVNRAVGQTLEHALVAFENSAARAPQAHVVEVRNEAPEARGGE
jgi:hypothetical protein